MARLVFGMNQSLDGRSTTWRCGSPTLFRHFIEEAPGQAGSVYAEGAKVARRTGRSSAR